MAQQPHPPSVVDRIISLVAAGYTRSAIAKQTGLTRSAVCGILHRQSVYSLAQRKPPKPRRSRRTITKAKPLANVMSTSDLKNKKFLNFEPGGIAWDDLDTARCCAWPVHDGLWCGAAKTAGSYCSAHFRLAYRRAASQIDFSRARLQATPKQAMTTNR
jgi:hypothetical protein